MAESGISAKAKSLSNVNQIIDPVAFKDGESVECSFFPSFLPSCAWYAPYYVIRTQQQPSSLTGQLFICSGDKT